MTSFLYYEDTVVITFSTLTFNMISSIFNLIKSRYRTLILGREMHNTAYSPFKKYQLQLSDFLFILCVMNEIYIFKKQPFLNSNQYFLLIKIYIRLNFSLRITFFINLNALNTKCFIFYMIPFNPKDLLCMYSVDILTHISTWTSTCQFIQNM